MSFLTGGYIIQEGEHFEPCPPDHIFGCAGPFGGQHEVDPEYLVPDDWFEDEDGYLRAPLSYMNVEGDPTRNGAFGG